MKRLMPCLLLMGFCTSISYGVFDFTISNTYEGGSVQLNNQSLLVTGGGANEIVAWGSSYVEVQNTAPLQQGVGGIYDLNLEDISTMNFYDGEVDAFAIYKNATAVFSGGSINYIYSHQDSDVLKHITFICDVDSVHLTGNLLTGDWLNGGGSFSVTLVNQSGYDSVYSNINFIPEPATVCLMGIGLLLLKKRCAS